MSLGRTGAVQRVDGPPPLTPGLPVGRWTGARLVVAGWAVTRLLVLLGAAFGHSDRQPGNLLHRIAVTWDGAWYLQIAQDGYSASLRAPVQGILHRFSDWAFFPGLPLLVRGVHEVTRLPYDATGLLVGQLTGLAAVLAVHRLATTYAGPEAARTAALLFVTWPGSVALSLTYSEGLGIASAALTLDALLRRRWALAGVAGLVATATRVTGIAVVAAALVVAVLAVRRRREWRALLAPLVGAAGMAGFLLYGWARTGDPLVWRHAEALWSQRFDLLVRMGQYWLTAVPHGAPKAMLQLLGSVALIWLLALALGGRLDWRDPLVVTTAVTLVLILGSSTVGPRPRMVLTAFPLLVLAAPHVPRRTANVVAVASATLLAPVAYLWMSHLVTP